MQLFKTLGRKQGTRLCFSCCVLLQHVCEQFHRGRAIDMVFLYADIFRSGFSNVVRAPIQSGKMINSNLLSR